MTSIFFNILPVFGLIIYCGGASVQLFKSDDFAGDIKVVNSSTSCQSIPTDFNTFRSIKTTGCIAVFHYDGCNSYVDGTNDIIVKSPTSELGRTRRSFRDCNELESGHQVNLDYYTESNRRGNKVEFRDVCTCTNLLPTDSQSTNNYGHCLQFYSESNCGGSVYRTDKLSYTYDEFSQQKSFLPCKIPKHCGSRLKATIIDIKPASNIEEIPEPLQKIPIGRKRTFINKGTHTENYFFEASKDILETLEIELPEGFSQVTYITLKNDVQNIPAFLNDLLADPKSNFSIMSPNFFINSTKEVWVQKMISMEPCTKYEVTPFLEIEENAEYLYQVQLNLTGEKIDFEKRSAEEIRGELKDVTYSIDPQSDAFSVIVESTIKLKANYVLDFGVDITSTPMSSCPHQRPTFIANILYYEPTSNISALQKITKNVPFSAKQTFINNSSATEENKYGAEVEIPELAQFKFPKELEKIDMINFENMEASDFEKSIPFLAFAWKKLQTEMTDFKDQSNSSEMKTRGIQRNTEFRVQKRITLPPCTKYEISSFVQLVENLQMGYGLTIRVTAQVKSGRLRAEEIRRHLKHLTFSNLANTDEFSVLIETTLKVTLNYGVASLDNGESTPMFDCIASQAAAVANCSFTCNR